MTVRGHLPATCTQEITLSALISAIKMFAHTVAFKSSNHCTRYENKRFHHPVTYVKFTLKKRCFINILNSICAECTFIILDKQRWADASVEEEQCMVGDVNIFLTDPSDPSLAELEVMIAGDAQRVYLKNYSKAKACVLVFTCKPFPAYISLFRHVFPAVVVFFLP